MKIAGGSSLAEARCLIDRLRLHYKHRHVQWALGKLTPGAFAATCCPALPPLRLAAAPPGLEGVATMHQPSSGVDRRQRPSQQHSNWLLAAHLASGGGELSSRHESMNPNVWNCRYLELSRSFCG